ncbi:MAG: alpha/beta fold hydrolase [Burkholderiales bacterium]|nr:alpha/beta fold hydrolase [Burkholderiales bacterium]
MLKHVEAGVLEIAYQESGSVDGKPVVLLHGFPYDIHAYDEVVPQLASSGCRVLVPYLRGFGPTRFHRGDTARSGQQAALAHDLLSFLDALQIPSAVLAGYDWGGRAACIVAALWPERVGGLVSGGGYNIQDIPGSGKPLPPQFEHVLWYQYYFHSERGRGGLQRYRRELCSLLWRLWSPGWHFDDATYQRTAVSFDNLDFVEVVIHSYRHRFGLVAGDPALEATEERLSALPAIAVPTVVVHGSDNGILPSYVSEQHDRYFRGPYERRVIAGVGHNLPQEAPQPFAAAVTSLI